MSNFCSALRIDPASRRAGPGLPAALLCLLIVLPFSDACCITWEALDKMQVNQPAVFYDSVTVLDPDTTHNATLWVSTSATEPHLYVATNGSVGMGTAAPATRLDVVSTGNTANDYVQIWRDSAGTIVASMSATGVMTALSAEAIPNSVAFFNLSSCPPGWTDRTSTWGGLYVVALPSGGTVGSIVGTALSANESRPAGQHNHAISETSHLHGNGASTSGEQGRPVAATTGYLSESVNSVSGDSQAGITVDNSSGASGTAGTNAPYVALRICIKD